MNYRLGMKYWSYVSVRICSRPQNMPIQLPYSWFGSVQTFEFFEIELQAGPIKAARKRTAFQFALGALPEALR